MNILTYVAVLFVGVSSSLLEEADVHFRSFKVHHEKFYRNQAEEAKRFSIFTENLKSIEEHNALYKQGITTWEKGVTQYTDWTDEEYRSMLALQKFPLPNMIEGSKLDNIPQVEVPDAIDWREAGQVTEVRDQGACAGSWAISVAGSTEGAYYRKSGKLVPLSPQQLIDCSSEVGNQGCSGGYLHETMPYLQWHGIESDESYPYNGKTEDCQYNESAVVIKTDTFKSFSYNQYELQQVVGNIGPVSASFIADEIKDYKSGIYQSETCDNSAPNLAVLVVGYGTENGTNYWIVKNCYGKSWGEDGYIRVLRKGNYLSCGLYNENSYPIIY